MSKIKIESWEVAEYDPAIAKPPKGITSIGPGQQDARSDLEREMRQFLYLTVLEIARATEENPTTVRAILEAASDYMAASLRRRAEVTLGGISLKCEGRGKKWGVFAHGSNLLRRLIDASTVGTIGSHFERTRDFTGEVPEGITNL